LKPNLHNIETRIADCNHILQNDKDS